MIVIIFLSNREGSPCSKTAQGIWNIPYHPKIPIFSPVSTPSVLHQPIIHPLQSSPIPNNRHSMVMPSSATPLVDTTRIEPKITTRIHGHRHRLVCNSLQQRHLVSRHPLIAIDHCCLGHEVLISVADAIVASSHIWVLCFGGESTTLLYVCEGKICPTTITCLTLVVAVQHLLCRQCH